VYNSTKFEVSAFIGYQTLKHRFLNVFSHFFMFIVFLVIFVSSLISICAVTMMVHVSF